MGTGMSLKHIKNAEQRTDQTHQSMARQHFHLDRRKRMHKTVMLMTLLTCHLMLSGAQSPWSELTRKHTVL